MTLLDTHLEQIELCASIISELPFPSPGIFTNALLYLPDITALIRDPDSHETALFSVVPPTNFPSAPEGINKATRHSTIFDLSENAAEGNGGFIAPRRKTAVAAVLGGDMAERIRRERMDQPQAARRRTGTIKDEMDIELLLKGAEKLCKVYPMPGALDRISALRMRHDEVATSIERYERMTTEQNKQLKQMHRSSSFGAAEVEDEGDGIDSVQAVRPKPLTLEDLKRDEEGIRELERRKRTLEERVSGMKKDLGGILR